MARPATMTGSQALRGSRSLSGAVRRSVAKSKATAIQKRPSRMVVGSRPRRMRAVPMGAAMLKDRVESSAADQPMREEEGRDMEGGGRWEVGSWKLEVGSWKLEVGSWKLEVGSWKLEVGSRMSDVRNHVSGVAGYREC